MFKPSRIRTINRRPRLLHLQCCMVSRERERTHTFIEKSRARSSRCCSQPLVGWVGNKGVDINWDASPVSTPATVLIQCGEVNKVNEVNKML